jgi:hypothetical protein
MASLVVDDATLLLLVLIIIVFSLSLHIAHLYTPSIHPLILARQADVSPTHRTRESPVYRNVNAPAGFELAARPSRHVNDVAQLLHAAAGTQQAQTDKATGAQRSLFGTPASLDRVQADAVAFAAGVQLALGEAQGAVALCVAHDSYDALVTLLSPASSRGHKQGALELFVASSTLPIPSAGVSIKTVVTDLSSLDAALQLPLAADAILILPSAADADVARSRCALRALVFADILSQGRASSSSPSEQETQAHDASTTYAHFAAAGAWVPVTHAHLVAGTTAQLAFYAADAVPTSSDVLLLERASLLSACASPSALALALAALYTGASIVSAPLVEGGKISPEAQRANASLLYLTASTSSAFAAALSSLASSPLTPLARHLKLAALRAGVLSAGALPDSLVFGATRRRAGLSHVRAATLVGEGQVSQTTLDALRISLGCAVMHSLLPSLPAGALTAPIAASHALDLQAFAAPPISGRATPAHVGPPAVSVELKLVQSRTARQKGYGKLEAKGTEEDPVGEVSHSLAALPPPPLCVC